MTSIEAVEIAREYAVTQNWPWKEPVKCSKRGGWFTSASWEVRSNADSRGSNVLIIVDETSKSVSSGKFFPR